MKHFELNKIYCSKGGCGCGYDRISWNKYFMPVKKNKSSIWVVEYEITTEMYGKDLHTKDEADKLAKKYFDSIYLESQRKTLRTDNDDYEYIIYKGDYTFRKYVNEI